MDRCIESTVAQHSTARRSNAKEAIQRLKHLYPRVRHDLRGQAEDVVVCARIEIGQLLPLRRTGQIKILVLPQEVRSQSKP